MSLQPLIAKKSKGFFFRSNRNIIVNLQAGKDLREHLVQLVVQIEKWRSGDCAMCEDLPGHLDLCLGILKEGRVLRACFALGPA